MIKLVSYKISANWNHKNVHTLITNRNGEFSNISKELDRIKWLRRLNNLKKNKYFLKNILPHNLFLLLQKTKHYLFKKFN